MTAPTVTLDNCADEPIHIPGSIQPHGVLLACRADSLVIVQVSANVATYLDAAPAEVLGTSVLDLFQPGSAARLRDITREPTPRAFNPTRLTSRTGRVFEGVFHRTKRDLVFVVELEPVEDLVAEPTATYDPRLRTSVIRLQSARSVQALYEITAAEVARITGFDRVMVYRFDADWNGEVVAEVKRPDLPPFLGQHYPASDIPAQARRLYTLNWLRFIADARYVPSVLVPPLDPADGEPLDMANAVLRSVSPIHLEYLANMGVRASMSVSLVIEGQLAGLIACHHYSGPRLIAYRTRDTAEYLGQALSWQLDVLRTAQIAENTAATQGRQADLVRALSSSTELLEALASPALLALTGAEGAAVVLQDGTRVLGAAPTQAELEPFVRWLVSHDHDVFATDRLGERFPAAEGWSQNVAGVVAVAVSRELGEYLLWFRPSTERTLSWAGNPHKVEIVDGTGAPRLSPRGSFELWRETVRGRSLPWEPWEVEAASSLRRALLGGIRRRAVELRELNQRLVDADRSKDAFISTVSHELRTPLNAITGWTQLLQNGSLGPERWSHALDVIARNARAQGQIVEDLLDVSRITSNKLTLEVESVDLVSLVESALDGATLAVEAKGLRLRRVLDTTATPVLGDVARLRQIVGNLLTNALKFTPKGGSIKVTLARVGSDVELSVIDSGRGISAAFLPHVFEAFRQEDPGMNRRSQGLGLGLAIVKKLVELHGGRIEVESRGEGLGATFRVRLPMAPVRAPSVPEAERGRAAERAPAEGPRELAGVRVLVVEDEDDARELLAHVLGLTGAIVTLAEGVDTALALTTSEPFDLIVSDIGMPGKDGLTFLRTLRGRSPEQNGNTPAVALTAYTRAIDRTSALKAGFQAHVPKPVDAAELVVVIASLVGRLTPR